MVSVLGRKAVAVKELRSLFTWLGGREEFRGRVRLVEAAPEPGTLGGWPEVLAVALGEGGALTVLASAVVSWVRSRTSDVMLTISRPGGMSVEVTTAGVRGMDQASLRELIKQTIAALDGENTERRRDGGSPK